MKKTTITLFFATKLAAMLMSGLSIYLGYRLFVLGVTGKASLVVGSKEFYAQLLNAAPGLFFAVGGLICLGLTICKSYKIDVND